MDSAGKPLKGQTGNPAKYGDTRVQSLFNELPNKLNTAFIGMSERVNGVKACLFNTDCVGLKRTDLELTEDNNINKYLNLWNDM